MTEKVRKRRDAIINVAFLAMVLGLIFLFFKYCFGIASPFIVSFFLAVLLQRPLRWLDKKTKNKCHGLMSILLVFFCLIIILGPVVLILTLIGKEISNFVGFISQQLSDIPNLLATLQNELIKFLDFLPEDIYTTVSDSLTEFFGRLINNFSMDALDDLGVDIKSVATGLTTGISGVYSVVKNIPSVLIGVVIGVVAWIFFTKDYRYIVNFIKLQLPENKKNLLGDFKHIFSKTVLKMIKAYALIMFITFCELFIGFTILNAIGVSNNSYAAIVAAGIAIFDILPVAGSGGILIPWMIISLIMGNVGQAVGLLVIYIVISVIRQYIEPKIVGTSLGVHPIVTLAGLYFGLKLFGFMGMFIVPITVMTVKAFNDAGRIHLYNSPDRN